VALDDAMNALAAISPRKVQVVEMRFFGGLSVEETAEVLKDVRRHGDARLEQRPRPGFYREFEPRMNQWTRSFTPRWNWLRSGATGI